MSDASQRDALRWRDPIVAEVRAAREALLAEAGYDLHTLCESLRSRQAAEGRPAVSRPPRPVASDAGQTA